MGFGYLFIGYIFMLSFPYRGLDIFPDAVGFIIAYIGLRTLSEYGCGFDNLKRYFKLMIPVSVLHLIFQILGFCNINIMFLGLWDYIYVAFVLLFNIMLIVAIYRIAKDTELPVIQAKAQRNLVLCLIYYFIIFFFSLPFSFIEKTEVYLATHFAFGAMMYIFGYIWLFLNASLIFSCYAWICQPGDVDMPMKEKKFFKNKSDGDEDK